MLGIACDVPQWILDIFNKVDFKATDPITKMGLKIKIKNWVKENLIEKSKTKKYSKKPGDAPKARSKDFDEDLLNMINKVDWEASSMDKKNEMAIWLNNNIYNYLPKKTK